MVLQGSESCSHFLKPGATPGLIRWGARFKIGGAHEDYTCRGSGGRKSPSGVQGQSSGRGSGGRNPPEADAVFLILDTISVPNCDAYCLLQTIKTIKFVQTYIILDDDL